MWELFSTMHLHPIALQNMVSLSERKSTASEEQLVRYTTESESSLLSRYGYKPPLLVSILNMAIPTVAWELVRFNFHNRRQPPYSKPPKPVSGDGKSHPTNFRDRSIIMQTAVHTVKKASM